VKAIILAAGVGRRLGSYTDRHPKSLLRFGSETLLRRHLHLLGASGIEEITVVAGHLAEQVEAEVGASACSVPVRIVINPLYRRGSALSVLAASDVLANSDCLLMDADLLYEKALLERLLRAESPNCLLVDSGFVDSGEEVKVVTRPDGRAWKLGKSVPGEGEVAGESVGIFKFARPAGLRLVNLLRCMVEGDPDVEYEMAISDLMQDFDLACVTVAGLAWIEIDFPEDVERARTQVYPRLGEA
jgi:choline kinase